MLDNIKKLICLGKNPTPHNLEIKAQCRPIKTTLLKGKIKLLRFPSAPVLLLNGLYLSSSNLWQGTSWMEIEKVKSI
jgi:hypothetical protein